MTQQQRDTLDQLLRDGTLDLGGDVAEQREIFEEMMAAIPLPADVTTTPGSLDQVPVTNVEVAGRKPERVIFYLHGGAYAIGSAASSVGLASDLARRAGTRLVTIDYRLAPEHPYPAALEDAVRAYRGLLDTGVSPSAIAVAGESAGAGLAAALLVALKDAGLPQPAAAVLMSPWADLTLSGNSIRAKAAVDPALTPDGLARRAADYLAGSDPAEALVSPIFADLSGLAPLLIQAGSHEILLDDATRLAARAAAADVAVSLEVTPGAPHVFQGFAATLDEGDAALTSAGEFVRTHLAGPPAALASPTLSGGSAGSLS
jgi:acetyl esterase/lipase